MGVNVRSPIPNARRIVTYEDRGETIDIEWQLLENPPMAGQDMPSDRNRGDTFLFQ